MRKDYRHISAESGEQEAVGFWSAVWEDIPIERESAALTKQVEGSDEFKVVRRHLETQSSHRRRVLDGGCGLGSWVAYLGQRGYDAVGVDFSAPTVERLREAFPDLRWLNGDITALSLPDEACDVYLSWGTFEHFEAGLSPPLVEAHRILDRGGLLLFSVPYESMRVRLQDYNPGQGDQATSLTFYQWRFSSRELQLECMRHGFEVVELTPIHTREGARRLVRSLGAGKIRGWPAELVARVLERLLPASWIGHMILVVARKRD